MPSSLHLSAAELRSLITDGDLGEILELLLDHPALLPIFLHFASTCRTLRRLEGLLSEMQNNLDAVFEDMTRNNFDDAFTFFVTHRRQEQQRAQPSSYSSIPPQSRHVHFQTTAPSTSSTPSPDPSFQSHAPSTPSPIDDRRDTHIPQRHPTTQIICPWCRQRGHTYGNCVWR
jgi:hypothetical protein